MNNTTYELVDEELMNFIKVCGTLKTLPMKAKELPLERKYCHKCSNWLGGNDCSKAGKIVNPDIYDCSFYDEDIKPKLVRGYRRMK